MHLPDRTGGEGSGPHLETLRAGLQERIGRIESRHAILTLDAIVSLLEPPYDAEICIEALVGVAELVAGRRLLAEAARGGCEADREPF